MSTLRRIGPKWDVIREVVYRVVHLLTLTLIWEVPQSCLAEGSYRDRQKAWLFAKLQPGRARKRINAT